MSERPAPQPGREEPYTVDDLIADEKRQLRFVAVIFVLAVIYFAAGGKLPGGAGEGETPAPVTSADR